MPIISHDDFSFTSGVSYPVNKVRGRKIVTQANGATASELWEQYQEPGGINNFHYHDVEELIVFLSGRSTVTIDGESCEVVAPCTLLIPPEAVHKIENTGEEDTHYLAFFSCVNPKIIWMQPLVLPDE